MIMYYDIIVAIMIFSVRAIIYSKVQTDFYKAQLPSVKYYIETGYVSVGDLTKSDNRLFYSLYLKENVLSKADIKDDDDVVLWIDGGPGCSSQYTNFNQNGPIFVDSDQQLHSRETAWNKLVHILYVDQPFGTGLSYWTKEEVMSSSWEAADYVVDLLKQYYNQNPELKRTKLHIWGESYGGHYVPVLAEKIKKANLFNLVGIGIGGAWSHPEVQVSPTIQQLISYGVIDQHRQSIMMKQYTESFKLLENEEYDKYVLYRDVDVMFNQYVGPCDRYNIQKYNVIEDDSYADYINNNKQQLGIPDQITFVGCSETVYWAFAKDQTISVLSSIEYLLAQNIKVLVFQGQLDTVVSSTGVEYWVNKLNWDELPQWKQQKKTAWLYKDPQTQQNVPGGTIKSYKNLHFVMVYRAGHNAAVDQQESVFQMFQNYFIV